MLRLDLFFLPLLLLSLCILYTVYELLDVGNDPRIPFNDPCFFLITLFRTKIFLQFLRPTTLNHISRTRCGPSDFF